MMTSEQTVPDVLTQSQRKRDHEIDQRYGAIGIAAVAAAVRYQGASEIKAQTPRGSERENGGLRPDRAA
jgi:hypothetical protein